MSPEQLTKWSIYRPSQQKEDNPDQAGAREYVATLWSHIVHEPPGPARKQAILEVARNYRVCPCWLVWMFIEERRRFRTQTQR